MSGVKVLRAVLLAVLITLSAFAVAPTPAAQALPGFPGPCLSRLENTEHEIIRDGEVVAMGSCSTVWVDVSETVKVPRCVCDN